MILIVVTHNIVILALLTVLNEAALWGLTMLYSLSNVMHNTSRVLIVAKVWKQNPDILQSHIWSGDICVIWIVFKCISNAKKIKQVFRQDRFRKHISIYKQINLNLNKDDYV